MNYYYFNPFNKQYLFPQGFKKIGLFQTFYQPYTLKGKCLWKLWYHLDFIRYWSKVPNPSAIVPLLQLKPYISSSSVLAFNRGSNGVEQKISILGVDKANNSEFFIKYADSEVARINVNNEGAILQQIEQLDFVPKLKQHVNETYFTFIATSILKGVRVAQQNINEQVLDVLKTLSELNIITTKKTSSELKTCFAHGDFCPWNMMLHHQKLQLFDWEMAGTYPLGYDLFTFIFQTSFLLTPQKKITETKTTASPLINQYFKTQGIDNWNPYLLAFANIKLELETAKNNQYLITYYQQLKTHAEKA